MNIYLSALVIILFNLLVAYIISFYSFIIAVGWFCFSIGFQLGKWYGENRKEHEFIAREEAIRSEYEDDGEEDNIS